MIFIKMERVANIVGMSVNEEKTKCMAIPKNKNQFRYQNLIMNEYNFDKVSKFRYLGSILYLTRTIT